jgi:Ornithine carbamoyltransferase
MIFQKRSTRTRVSTETGMSLLGGHALFLGPSDIQLGVNECMRDTAQVLSGFNSIILARVYGHKDIEELAQYATVPVINALSDMHHPLQTLADLMALEERFGADNIRGKTLAWVGDGNK